MMDAALRDFVRERAGRRCEYCRLHEDDADLLAFRVEHIVAKKHGGNRSLILIRKITGRKLSGRVTLESHKINLGVTVRALGIRAITPIAKPSQLQVFSFQNPRNA